MIHFKFGADCDVKSVAVPWRVTCLALVLALAGMFALWQQSAAQTPAGTGVIEGRAVVASGGSNAPLNDLPVSLFTFIGGVRQTPPAVGQTDAQGHVRFAQLNTSSNVTYTLFIKFQDTIYGSDVIAFAAGSALAQAAVKVYDSTSSDLALRADQHHLVIDVDNERQSLVVLEFYQLSNKGDRVIAGTADSAASGKRVSFRAPLPPDALIESIEARQPNENIFQSANQLLDTVPIPIGQSALIFSYRVPYQRATFALAVGTPVTTTALNILIAPGIGVRSPRLTSQGNVAAGERQFQYFTARDLPAGTSLALELNGLPAPLIPLDILQWLPLVAVSLALIVALFIANRRNNDRVTSRRQTPA